MYDEETNIDSIFGTQEYFEKQYGQTTTDGVPRFGEDYAFLHHPSELNTRDRIAITIDNFLSFFR